MIKWNRCSKYIRCHNKWKESKREQTRQRHRHVELNAIFRHLPSAGHCWPNGCPEQDCIVVHPPSNIMEVKKRVWDWEMCHLSSHTADMLADKDGFICSFFVKHSFSFQRNSGLLNSHSKQIYIFSCTGWRQGLEAPILQTEEWILYELHMTEEKQPPV